jgi:hypothetical protein
MNDETNNQFNENTTPDNDVHSQPPPARHGCVTTWLVIMLIANSLVTLIYIVQAFFKQTLVVPFGALLALSITGLINVVSSILLLSWRKIGFYCFAITAVITLIINLNIGLSLGKSIFGFAGAGILYAILQIKQDGVSAWDNLK